jgi:tetratricopeptide (TPR) repeat protein
MKRFLLVAVCLLAPLCAIGDEPVRADKPPAGFVPPVPKGIEGDGTARHADKPIPFPAARDQWLRVMTKHFDIISNSSEKRTRTLAANLETLAAALVELHPRFQPATISRTRMIVFSRRRDSQPYFDLLLNRRNAEATGVFVSQKDGGSMVIDDSGWRTARAPFHELIHYLLASSTATRPPLWLEEGLAEYFSDAQIGSGSIVAGRPIGEHVELLRRRAKVSLFDVFAAKYESDASATPLFYATSWAAVDWLLATDRTAFDDFLRDAEEGVPVETALKNRYGKSVSDLERGIGTYGVSSGFAPGVRLAVPHADRSMEMMRLSRADILYELGWYLSGIEDASAEAERHLREAIAVDANHARAMAAIGAMRANEKKFDDATPWFERALAAAASDGTVRLMYAEALLQNEIGPFAETDELKDDAAPRFRKARALAEDALRLGADPGRANGAIGTSYIIENDFAPGIALLEKASNLLPSRGDYALHLFALLRRAGEKPRADALFARLEGMHSAQLKFAARSIVVRQELDKANDLTRRQKLDEAATVIRDLAASTPDPDARADLERQAAQIAAVAETNRHIVLYNKAIAELNAGDRKGALKTLTGLLDVAKDPSIVADARKLQQRLKAAR